jgi:hypothetical protein
MIANLPVLNQAGQNINSVPFVRVDAQRTSVLNDLANEICQEASGTKGSWPISGTASASQQALAPRRHSQLQRPEVALWQEDAPSSPLEGQAVASPEIDAALMKRQVQVYPYGARIKKNKLGQIVEISSPLGQQIAFEHSPQGVLKSFTRLFSSSKVHSVGALEQDRVVVKDGEGEVILVGESMTVSPSGCLIIRGSKEEFSCVDLMRGMYTERRYIRRRSGVLVSLTAVFAFDGFRMVTAFQSIPDESDQSNKSSQYSQAVPENCWRFYGRDGSMIEFDSYEKFKLRQPSYTRSAETKAITSTFQGRAQGHTAWDSVSANTSADWQYFQDFMSEA